ncbi:MAG: potassium/proton antiporter [Rhodobiaceae bacterium]|nr:potassium/proton antiporter [Rhodobiaceae bacterium]MCC0056029.1 potassium/proton antiporter [Rhodobiaceae bacterium]
MHCQKVAASVTSWIFPALMIGAALVLVSVLTSTLAFRFGAPLLFIFLGVGMLAGEDGLGIYFDNATAAYFIGSTALAVILFDSGLNTTWRSLRQVAGPSFVLASVGVALTAALTGAATHYAFGLPWLDALLFGAIVGSTDAAAVFFLLRVGGIAIRDNVRSTLEIESGSNDPMAIFLTLLLVQVIMIGGDAGDLSRELLTGFVAQMGRGLLLGLAGGYLIVLMANRLPLQGALYPIAILAAALTLFGLTGISEGSGFLAVYVAGIVAGNAGIGGLAGLRRFLDGMTWLAQIGMFLTFGLLTTPSQFIGVLLPATGVALALIFVARPLAVWLCLIPFGYRRNETAFVSWVGLRGAVSIMLGIIPLTAGLENGQLLFNAACVVVLVSLLVQGWTIGPMARWLGVAVPPRIGPVERFGLELPGTADHELIAYRVVAGSPVLQGSRLPRWARPSLVIREGRSMRFQYAGRLQVNDLVYMFVSPPFVRLLDRLFASPKELAEGDEDFYGKFVIDPSQPLPALAEAYGLELPAGIADGLTIGGFIGDRLGGAVEVGDRVTLGAVALIVRDVGADGTASEVGLAIEPEAGAPKLPLFLSGREMWDALKTRLRRKG